MIYLKDEATGVTVEDTKIYGKTVFVDVTDQPLYLTDETADALLRGLLRWKLETTNELSARERAILRLAEVIGNASLNEQWALESELGWQMVPKERSR